MLIRILTLLRSASTLSTLPLKSANAPSITRTVSPGEKAMRGRSLLSRMERLISSTSSGERGTGLPPDSTKPVTPGVVRTSVQVSSSRIISTST
jgi:hypothetical protein